MTATTDLERVRRDVDEAKRRLGDWVDDPATPTEAEASLAIAVEALLRAVATLAGVVERMEPKP